MNINTNHRIVLSADDLRKIIAEHMTTEGYKVEVKDINFKIEYDSSDGSYLHSAKFEAKHIGGKQHG